VKQSKYVSSERRAINRTLDQFIPAALDGSSPATAWRLAGPDLKGGTTLSQWRHGTSPIPRYQPRGKTFHDWTTIDAGPGYVDFNILVHPRKGAKTTGSYVFAGSMLKRGGRWLVNGLYTTAIFARPDKKGQHEVGPADFGAACRAATRRRHRRRAEATCWEDVAARRAVVVLALLLRSASASPPSRERRSRKRYAQSAPRNCRRCRVAWDVTASGGAPMSDQQH
jgi:hypothetical protein